MVKCFSIFKDIYIGIFISILSLSFFSCSSEFQDNYQDRDDGYLDIFFQKRRQGLILQMMVPEVLQRAIKLGFTFNAIKVFLIVNLHIREDSGCHV